MKRVHDQRVTVIAEGKGWMRYRGEDGETYTILRRNREGEAFSEIVDLLMEAYAPVWEALAKS